MRTPNPLIELALPARRAGSSAVSWLCDGVRAAIADGRLRPGTNLPSTRALARHLGLARRTVIAAYDELQSHGYLEAKARSGWAVTSGSSDPVLRADLGPPLAAATPRASASRALSIVSQRTGRFDRFRRTPPVAFRAHSPALELFPTALWARLVARRSRAATRGQLTGTDALGSAELRDVVTDYLRRARGVRCEPAQVAIVSGVQEALSLVARLLVEPGDAVGVEDPGYTGAVRALESAGATLVSLRVDAEGARVPVAGQRVRLVYVTPAHQFPLGTSMSLSRRLALLSWAQASSALIFEDDYDSEYRYSGTPLPALQALDRHDSVVFAGSFSKVLFPGIRLGYLVVPPDLVDPLERLLSVEGRQAPTLEQLVLRDFLADGHFHRHLRRMRDVYSGRLATLQTLARTHLDGLLDLSPIEAGLQTAACLRVGIGAGEVASAALDRGVEVTPLARYARSPLPFEGVLLGFGAVDAAETARGVDALVAILSSGRRPSPS